MSDEARLACFGGRTIRFDGFVAGLQYGGDCASEPVLGEGWLNPCGGTYHHIIAPNGLVGGPVHLSPDLSSDDLPAERNVTIWAHFDDPAAQSCGMVRGDAEIDPDTACRYLLVAEEVFVHP